MRKGKLVFYIMMLCVLSLSAQENMRNINPYSYLIGNSAVDRSSEFYSINPASTGLVTSSFLFQDFSLTPNNENILFSQNLLLSLSQMHTAMIGYSLINDNKVNLGNSMFRFNYALNLENFLYIGANCTYKDKNYIKYHDENLLTDLGMITSIKLGETIRFINFGVYSLDANIEKINLEFPNTNFGKYSALGFALGLQLSESLNAILSADAELVRDNHILSQKQKVYKYGVQFDLNDALAFMGSADYVKRSAVGHTVGAKASLRFFYLTYVAKKFYQANTETQYLSFSFKLSDSSVNNVIQQKKSMDDDKIKMIYYQEDKKYKIVFEGEKEDIDYWHLTISDENGKVVKEFRAKDHLPEKLTWTGRDSENKELKQNKYEIKLVYIKDGIIARVYEEKKNINRDFL